MRIYSVILLVFLLVACAKRMPDRVVVINSSDVPQLYFSVADKSKVNNLNGLLKVKSNKLIYEGQALDDNYGSNGFNTFSLSPNKDKLLYVKEKKTGDDYSLGGLVLYDMNNKSKKKH